MRTPRLLTFAIALSIAALASAQTEPPPAPAEPKGFTLPAVRKFELPNGMKVRLIQYGNVPKATARLVTLTGNANEGPNETWLADLTGDLMEQGTKSRTAEQIALEAASMGGSVDVSVGVHQTYINADVLSESAADAVAIIADLVRNPRLPESEVARLKADMKRVLALQLSQPQSLAAEKFYAVTFPGHAYGRYFPTAEMIDSYTIDQVRTFYDRNFGAARSAIYVAGQFDTAAVESTIRRAFADWKTGTSPDAVSVEPVGKRALYVIDRPGSVQSTLYIGLPTIDPTSTDYVPLVVMNALLGGSFSSRITSNIREQKGYTYSPFSTVSTRLGASTWAEVADVTTNVTGASIHEILGEIERLRREPPTQKELQAIQNYLAGTFVLQNSSRGGIINQLSFLDLYRLPEDYLRTYVQRIHALTPADIQQMAQRYIDPDRLAIVIVGDRQAIAEQIAPYGTIVQ